MPSLIILAKVKRRKDKQKIFVKKEQAHVWNGPWHFSMHEEKKEQAHVPTKKIQVKGSNEPVTQWSLAVLQSS